MICNCNINIYYINNSIIGFVSKDDFANIIQALGVYIPDSELDTLKSTLVDFEKPEIIKFNPMFAWFQKVASDPQ